MKSNRMVLLVPMGAFLVIAGPSAANTNSAVDEAVTPAKPAAGNSPSPIRSIFKAVSNSAQNSGDRSSQSRHRADLTRTFDWHRALSDIGHYGLRQHNEALNNVLHAADKIGKTRGKNAEPSFIVPSAINALMKPLPDSGGNAHLLSEAKILRRKTATLLLKKGSRNLTAEQRTHLRHLSGKQGPFQMIRSAVKSAYSKIRSRFPRKATTN